jgi:hypothetical protein
MAPKSNTSAPATTLHTLKEVAQELGLTEFRVRSAIRKGDLKTTMEPVKDGSKTNRHMIAEADVLAWRSATGSHTRRADGRNKYNIYMTPAEYDQVMALLVDAKLETPVIRANTHKVVAEAEAEAEIE